MRNILLFIAASLVLLISCQPKKKLLTPEQVEQEKEAIVQVINDYNSASENKDFGAIVSCLADEVIFFGTDSSEIIKTFAEFKEAIQKQWQEYDKIKYGPLNDVSIQMDDDATLASIIFGMSADVERAGVHNMYYVRVARTLKKKESKWYIVSGIMGIVRTTAEENAAYVDEQDTTKTKVEE
jgi:ketosteroid isomerase-like protein